MYSYSVNYPKKALENKISGEVMIEYDRYENCALANPKVIKGLGYGCDEEALRIAKQIVSSRFKCIIKCPNQKCEIGKVKQVIIFPLQEE